MVETFSSVTSTQSDTLHMFPYDRIFIAIILALAAFWLLDYVGLRDEWRKFAQAIVACAAVLYVLLGVLGFFAN